MRILREIGPPALALVLGAATTFGVGMLLLPPATPARTPTDASTRAAAVTAETPFEPGAATGAAAAASTPNVATTPADGGSGGSPVPPGVAPAAGAEVDVPAGGSDDEEEEGGAEPSRPAWTAPSGTQASTLRAEVGEITYVRCSSADAGRPTPGDRCGRLPAIERRVTQLLARDAGRCVRAVEPEADTLRLALEVRFDTTTLRVWAGQASTLQGVGGVIHCMRRVLLTGPEGTPRFGLEGIAHREDRYTMFVSLRFSAGDSQQSAPSSTSR